MKTLNKLCASKARILPPAIIFSVTAILSSCYAWFEDKVTYNDDTESVTLSTLMAEDKEVTKLSTPEQVIVSQGLYKDKIAITWSSVDYAKSYRVERAVSVPNSDGTYTVPDEGDYSVIKEYVYDTVYRDTILSSPSYSDSEYTYIYYYRICAENVGKGLESSDYTDPTEDLTDGTGWLLPPPSNVEAWKGKSTSEIQISWSEVDGASYYYIYRGEKENGNGMEYIDSVRGNETSYSNSILTSEQGTEFYYKVCAITSTGESSTYSAIAMGYTLLDGAPSAPDNVKVVDGLGTSKESLTVSWDDVSVADGYTLTYSVYRTSSSDSTYTCLKTGLSSTSYTDSSSLKTGVYYYYYVQSVSTDDSDSTSVLKGAFSDSGSDSDSPAIGFILSPTDSLSAEDGDTDSTINLTWYPALGAELGISYTYNIYYSDSASSDYEPLLYGVTGTENSSGYLVYEVTKKSFYKISTVNSSGLESSLSSAAAPLPSAPTSVTASKTAYVDGYMDENENTNSLGVFPVKITWSKPSDDEPYGYYVYRSTSRTSSFRKLNSAPTTELYYIDENTSAKAGTYYYYKVVSVNSLGQGSKSNDPSTDTSNSCRGWGALTRDQWFREYNNTIKQSQTKMTLMYKDGTSALGTETASGDISGTLYYNAAMSGIGAYITMLYTNYADYYVGDDSSLGVYFLLNGNTNTSANMSANGNMDGTNTASTDGMYPGYAVYDNLVIKSGAAGGGSYTVCTKDKDGNVVLKEGEVDWTVGEE